MTERPFGPAGGESIPPQRDDPRGPDGEPEGIRFVDKRVIDPQTFEARLPDAPPVVGDDAVPPTQPALTDDSAVKVDELTADLQRLSAEYANYRKRVERDREVQREVTLARVWADLLPVLDDIGRARDHGELDGGFKAVGEAVEALAAKYEVAPFGALGEAFDPNWHEAMTSETSAEVAEPTVTAVYQVGYRIKDRVIRPARVGVTDAE